MIFTPEHEAIRNTIAQFIDKEINPFADQWEEDGIFPAHALFKKMGDLGLLGISRPVEFGGMGLDYSYEVVFSEELGRIRAGGVGMAIGVQTDMATPALANHGSDELRKEFWCLPLPVTWCVLSPYQSHMQARMFRRLRPPL